MCNKLFIIGNGFDLAHHLETSYSNFREFLQDYNYSDVYEFIQNNCYIDSEWNEFESALGRVDVDNFLSPYQQEMYFDDNEDLTSVSNMIVALEQVFPDIERLRNCFGEWINSIDIDEAEPIEYFEERILQGSNYFLTFNYTDTLEKIYHIPSERILHIHGSLVNEDELQVGHGLPIQTLETYYEDPTNGYGTTSQIDEIHENENRIINSLRKDVPRILSEHISWFSNIAPVDEVYSFGFSYNNIDIPYVQAIVLHSLTEDATWYLHQYVGDKNIDYEHQIRNCGFTGEFLRWGL